MKSKIATEALSAICNGPDYNCEDQPYSFNHPKSGAWAYARSKDGLFIAVRNSNAAFPQSPKDVARHLANKKNPDFSTTAGELRAWTASLRPVETTGPCTFCGGEGSITDETVWEHAQAVVFDWRHTEHNWTIVEHMYRGGKLDQEIRDLAETEYGGFHKKPVRHRGEKHVTLDATPRTCHICSGTRQVTHSHHYGRLHLTIIDPGYLTTALARPFIHDSDEVTIHAPGCLRPRLKDVERRLYIRSEEWVISFKPHPYSAYGGGRKAGLPAADISDLADFLARNEPPPPPPTPEQSEASLAARKISLRALFHFEAGGTIRPDMRAARQHVIRFVKECDSPDHRVDLMLSFVETGLEFTRSFGEVDSSFDGSLKTMYQRALEAISALGRAPSRSAPATRLRLVTDLFKDVHGCEYTRQDEWLNDPCLLCVLCLITRSLYLIPYI